MKWFPPASMLTLQHLAKLTLLESEDGGNLFFVSPAKQKRDICTAFPASLSASASSAA